MTHASPSPDPSDPPPEPGNLSVRAVLTLVIIVVGLLGVALAATADRLDSALLFVGIPCLLAFAVSQIPGNGGWGSVMQTITIVLLLASALLREGAICVLLAAPLVYGVAGVVWLCSRSSRPQRYAVGPLLIVVALEGAIPGLRIASGQEATASRIVADHCEDFQSTLDRGPEVDPDAGRGRLLDIAGYPTPSAVDGDGFQVGDTWSLAMPTSSISTEVVRSTPGRIDFAVTDGAPVSRWVVLGGGSLSWQQTDDGCAAAITIDYERRLDPSWYFGPITAAFMDAGAHAFLGSLG